MVAPGAERLRRDLEAVGIPYTVEGPDGPEYADFHALRHTYLTMLGRNGVDLRTAQELAGHSTPLLTARYSHRRLYDLAGAVEKLPNLVPAPLPLTETLCMTGTEAAAGVVPGVVTGGAGLHQSAQPYTFGIVDGTSKHSPEVLEIERAGASQHRPASLCTKLPGLDSNQDKENQNPNALERIPNMNNNLHHPATLGCSAGRSDQHFEEGLADTELVRVIEAWPTLPDHIRRAMLALLDSAK